MNFTRRRMMQTVLLGGPLLAAGGARLALAASYKPSFFLLGGIDPSTSATQLFSALDPIVSQNVPVGCVIKFTDDDGTPMSFDSDLAKLLRELVANYSGLVELIAYLPDLAKDAPYFRMRRASQARAHCRQVLGQTAACLSVASDMPDGNIDEINEIRAGGFRNLLLVPHQARKAGYWKTDGGILQFYGGNPATPGGENPVEAALRNTETLRDALIVYVSLKENATTDADAFLLGAKIGDTLSIKNASGALFSTLPADLHLQSTDPYGRLIALRVEDSDDPATQAFIAALIAANIPYSLMGVAGQTDCLRIEGDATALNISTQMAIANTTCLSTTAIKLQSLPEFAQAGVEILSDSNPITNFSGLDGNGLFHLPIIYTFDGSIKIRTSADVIDDVVTAVGLGDDLAVAITANAVQEPTAIQAMVEAFSTFESAGIGKVVSLPEFRQISAPKDQKYSLLTSMKHQRALATQEILTDDQAELDKDAATAWHFFELFTDPETGLVPGTVWMEGESRSSYPFATMWDVGTHILALVSAHTLGLIDDTGFTNRATRLLAHLPTTSRANGLSLPQASVSITGRQEGQKGFDATDAGRLLISLKVLDEHVAGSMGIAEIVAGWDLDKTIKDGKIRSIRDGRFTSALDSSYTHYVSRGFALWGLEVDTPFPQHQSDTDMDAQMRVLGIVENNELLSTEPHVLEAVEIGYSAPARTLADVLYTQQMAEYEATGNLMCVSEGPLDREPWFSYQGYKLGDDDPWKVNIINSTARFQTAGFRRAVTMVSSKSAYLWSATRPQAYSQLLIDYIRQNARFEDLGFASGVFTATGLATKNYSDINTNGIILEALAYRKFNKSFI